MGSSLAKQSVSRVVKARGGVCALDEREEAIKKLFDPAVFDKETV
jgi:hypothetical protein